MLVGVPKEIKDNENRVGLIPATVKSLVANGHRVLVQQGAGLGSAISDEEYRQAGATLVTTAEEAWEAELVVKVKEPIESEYCLLRPDLLLFTYLHLASNQALTHALLNAGTTAVAYETVQTVSGQLPLLMPMSEVAGRMASQVGAYYLQRSNGGRGVLMGGVPGVTPAKVVILGGGVVGHNAAKVAVGMGAQVTITDISHARLQYLDDIYRGQLRTITSNQHSIEELIADADLLIGAVLVPGKKAPYLISRQMLKLMQPDSVIVDVAVDQGGCVETTRPTTHSQPTYREEGVLHYCVANMPGAVPRTSTFALNNQTSSYILRLAEHGLSAIKANSALLKGLNCFRGELTCQGVAEAFALNWREPDQLI